MEKLKIFFVALALLVICGPAKICGKIVRINPDMSVDSGEPQWKSTVKGRSFHAFLGIPYAEPPVGNLRFALPQRYSVRKSIIDAGINSSPYAGSTCSQMNFHEVNSFFNHLKISRRKKALKPSL